MRVNTVKSIRTANNVHSRFGSWNAAKESARFENGKFIVHSIKEGRIVISDTKPKSGASKSE